MMKPSPDPAAEAPPERHACYILRCTQSGRTYNGYTNHMARRLRQHNRELVGGARATGRGGPWEVIAVVVGDAAFTHTRALSLEWHIRYPTGRRPRPRSYDGAGGRIAGLALALKHPKFVDLALTAHVLPQFLTHP